MRLDDFIKNNKEEFNSEEPPKGHFERFEQRLKKSKQQQRHKTLNMRWLIGVAAAMAVLVIGLSIFMNSEEIMHRNSAPVCIMSSEMQETQTYYVSVLTAEAENVEKLLGNVDPDTRKEVMSDVKKIVADSESFSNDFCNSSDSGTAVMVEYYQSKIQALENISSIFETNKN